MLSALPSPRRRCRGLFAAVATLALALAGLLISACASHAAAQEPCDIYAAGGTPCVAAHSTTRALFASYAGPLYQVQRTSDNTFADIGTRSAGGAANAAAQDSFCAGTMCTITRVYDQTGNGNTLLYQGPGGTGGGSGSGWRSISPNAGGPRRRCGSARPGSGGCSTPRSSGC